MINPPQAYYIKLGRAGGWEEECLRDGILRFGYSETPHNLCVRGDWEGVWKLLKKQRGTDGAATRDTNQIRIFYEVGEEVLWITFVDGFLWWCFARPGVDEHPDGEGRVRRTVDDWHNVDANGAFLTTDIVQAIVDGRQPPTLTADSLIKSRHRMFWSHQRAWISAI